MLGMALDGAHLLAFEVMRAGDAGAHFLAGAVRVVDDHHAGVADALATAQAGAGEVLVFVQVVDHCQVFRHFGRTDGLTIQGHLKRAVSH